MDALCEIWKYNHGFYHNTFLNYYYVTNFQQYKINYYLIVRLLFQ